MRTYVRTDAENHEPPIDLGVMNRCLPLPANPYRILCDSI